MTSTELEQASDTSLFTIRNADDWAAAIAGADRVRGADLLKDDILTSLDGVPFLITAIVFRPGTLYGEGKAKIRMSYASIEATIAPAGELSRRRVDIDSLPFEPLDQVVFNDGSTGVYRQLVSYVEAKGYISIPSDKPENGGKGESRYDTPVWQWGLDGVSDPDDYAVRFELSNNCLYAPRGTRVSEYESDLAPNGARTRYLA